jgi:hypothetical protein
MGRPSDSREKRVTITLMKENRRKLDVIDTVSTHAKHAGFVLCLKISNTHKESDTNITCATLSTTNKATALPNSACRA